MRSVKDISRNDVADGVRPIPSVWQRIVDRLEAVFQIFNAKSN